MSLYVERQWPHPGSGGPSQRIGAHAAAHRRSPLSWPKTVGGARQQAAVGRIGQYDRCRTKIRLATGNTTEPTDARIQNATNWLGQSTRKRQRRTRQRDWQTTESKSRPCDPIVLAQRFVVVNADSTTSGPSIWTTSRITAQPTGQPEQARPEGPACSSTGFCVARDSRRAIKCCARTAISSNTTNGNDARSRNDGPIARRGDG